MNRERIKTFDNGSSLLVQDVREMPLEDFLQEIVDLSGERWRICAYFGVPDKDGADLWCILAGAQGRIGALRSRVSGSLPSITPVCPEIHLFEREIAEQCGIVLEDHPWFKPVRYHRSMRRGMDAWGRDRNEPILPGAGDFYQVEGEEVHEVAVGPVHAGIIEPGHFRFQCSGEKVFHLEIALGYQHRGIEQSLRGAPHPITIMQMETIAGDTSIGHATAYAMVMESLAGIDPTPEAEIIRAVALELERLANHCGDLGALAGDVGYLPTMSFCGRIRGDFLNMSAELCGSRFGRGLVRPGGTLFGCSTEKASSLLKKLEDVRKDYTGAVRLLWESPSVMARFERTGAVSKEDATALGLVGPAARACGLERDVRSDYPFGHYRNNPVAVHTEAAGDVLARARVRWGESGRSMDFITQQLTALAGGETMRSCGKTGKERLAVALVEGWRGEICHVAITDRVGQFLRYKIKDPSFHNWQGLSMALRNQEISDFPLCNKSFNLSYCGFDL